MTEYPLFMKIKMTEIERMLNEGMAYHQFKKQFNIEIQTIFNSQSAFHFLRIKMRSGTSLKRLVLRVQFNASQSSYTKQESSSATYITPTRYVIMTTNAVIKSSYYFNLLMMLPLGLSQLRFIKLNIFFFRI